MDCRKLQFAELKFDSEKEDTHWQQWPLAFSSRDLKKKMKIYVVDPASITLRVTNKEGEDCSMFQVWLQPEEHGATLKFPLMLDPQR